MEDRFETFTALIAKINRNIRRLENHEMSDYNLRSPQKSVLYFLYTSNGLTATELSEKCGVDKATISRSLGYLEDNGFLTCESKSAKRYRSLILLTEKGKTAAKKVADMIDSALSEISTGLTEEERAGLFRSLHIISESLEAINNRMATDKSE